ncbi:hypothetical protein V6N12_067115 [Hibiscus sabdariffa]|uniref:Uncharacterized protein n=1 Tax=Hibiscus sabdariffa TaxID=183260 RepID=A0ABR1ZUN5_9ROSI
MAGIPDPSGIRDPESRGSRESRSSISEVPNSQVNGVWSPCATSWEWRPCAAHNRRPKESCERKTKKIGEAYGRLETKNRKEKREREEVSPEE